MRLYESGIPAKLGGVEIRISPRNTVNLSGTCEPLVLGGCSNRIELKFDDNTEFFDLGHGLAMVDVAPFEPTQLRTSFARSFIVGDQGDGKAFVRSLPSDIAIEIRDGSQAVLDALRPKVTRNIERRLGARVKTQVVHLGGQTFFATKISGGSWDAFENLHRLLTGNSESPWFVHPEMPLDGTPFLVVGASVSSTDSCLGFLNPYGERVSGEDRYYIVEGTLYERRVSPRLLDMSDGIHILASSTIPGAQYSNPAKPKSE